MNKFKKISGVINAAMTLSSTNGMINTDYNSGNVHGSISTKHWTKFRIDNTPCYFESSINLSNGDRVTAVGKENGEFKVWVLDNETTNIRYTTNVHSEFLMYFLYLFGFFGIYLILMGFSTMFNSILGIFGSIAGIFIIIAGISCLSGFFLAKKIGKSRKELDKAQQMLRN